MVWRDSLGVEGGYFAPELSGCYAILTSHNEGETAVYGYNPALF